MATPPLSPQLAMEAIRAFNAANGNQAQAARLLGINQKTYQSRFRTAQLMMAKGGIDETPLITPYSSQSYGRIEIPEFEDGRLLICSDPHYLPGRATTGHRAFVAFIKEYKPKVVVMNGDVLDAGTVSRHPPIGWEKLPSVAEEIAESQERLGEIAKAAGAARLIWPLGNHDARFETRLASVAPEYRNVKGIHLKDHFPDWEACWSVFIGGPAGVVIKHRFKGGIHANHNNALWAGRTMVTGHLHSLKVTPISDYNGTRYGVDTGTLAEPFGDQFSYSEDNPRNWRQGFVMLTFREGRLLLPEIVQVCGDGKVEFRGEVISV